MPLGLDLSASDAKLARARVHLETLQREIPAAVAQRKPYAPRFGEIEPNSGWCSVFLTRNHPPEHGLSVVGGDLVHNLRCSLDYITAELVSASGATLGTKHQFPIFNSLKRYTKKVGTAALPRARGPLGGIKYGLQEIFDLQPFHKHPVPEGHRLALVQQFSNADKHRIISEFFPRLAALSTLFEYEVLEHWQSPGPIDWKPNIEYLFARFRFAKPYPPDSTELNLKLSVEIFFGTPPFGHDVKGSMVDIDVLQEMYEYVAMVLDRFKKL